MCERREGEDFEAYRARRKIENKIARESVKPFSYELRNNELVRMTHKAKHVTVKPKRGTGNVKTATSFVVKSKMGELKSSAD